MPDSGQRRVRPVERLTKGVQFRSVLSLGTRRSSVNFAIRAMPNGLTIPRLGIVAAKKIAKRSVDRNRGKRLVRELFRLGHGHAVMLASLDIVVQIRSDLRGSSSAVLRAELGGLLDKLGNIAAKPAIESPQIGLDLK